MMNPKVTFIVPCYNLGHFLAECVNSILSQTYQDFEVLIMDDCSPDQTPEIARSFCDARVKHIRNEPNLGHLRNYNKGIELARGQYVWMISADDCLRKPYVLERYVHVMEKNPNVGYVFCPAVKFVDGREKGILDWVYQEPKDKIFVCPDFLKLIIERCLVASPTGLVHKDCYKLSKFPLDLPFTGDWFLWCFFALHYDVAYLADPMVYYRLHDGNMTWDFMAQKSDQGIVNEVGMRWRVKRAAEHAGEMAAARLCEEAIVADYLRRVLRKLDYNWQFGLTVEGFEQSLASFTHDLVETQRLRARVYAGIGDSYYWKGERSQALNFYRIALKEQFSAKPWVKSTLLRMGEPGKRLLQTLSLAQQFIRP
jgi:glycosyltransferase involved in cell wall biosynthesis